MDQLHMNPNCPTCGQVLPKKLGRICGLCNNSIGKHERWHIVGSVVQHRDCANVEMLDAPPEHQPMLINDTQ